MINFVKRFSMFLSIYSLLILVLALLISNDMFLTYKPVWWAVIIFNSIWYICTAIKDHSTK